MSVSVDVTHPRPVLEEFVKTSIRRNEVHWGCVQQSFQVNKRKLLVEGGLGVEWWKKKSGCSKAYIWLVNRNIQEHLRSCFPAIVISFGSNKLI